MRSGVIVWALREYALRRDVAGGSMARHRPKLKLAPGLNDVAGRSKPALAEVRRACAGD